MAQGLYPAPFLWTWGGSNARLANDPSKGRFTCFINFESFLLQNVLFASVYHSDVVASLMSLPKRQKKVARNVLFLRAVPLGSA